MVFVELIDRGILDDKKVIINGLCWINW